MSTAISLGSLSYVLITFIILFGIAPASLYNALNTDGSTLVVAVFGQESNSTVASDAEILASINQTYLSLIPLMIKEVENTNASEIPIRQIMEATPSNVTALQDIVKNSSNRTTQDELNSSFTDVSSSNGGINSNNTLKPQDLIPVVVNMTQNTNATDIPIQNVINAVPSNVTALQDIVKNSSNRTSQDEFNSSFTDVSSSNGSVNSNNTLKPQDLIPVVVNMTQNTNASELGFMRVINSTPNLDTLNKSILN
ncbi:hypothetical protein [Candidatus Nitrosocosmicus franklandus]|uniref:HrpF protein n=1 Tax=Candidatus Nitrosocosmicus franklandianus TaxID=1798806 RepID=A0A484IB80_9ARCH|nr:hypothetical protein [Candidatus Nitrosocosmicus franklandus]VFJ15013.1 HrpF protein [Candidatus Nitrosocosmicus franklandus]